MQRTLSSEIFSRACALIPGGVNSPVRSFKKMGLSPPMIAESGSGSIVRDVDGHEYIDYCMSWGALIHGHAHPDIVDAAISQVKKGSSFGIATSLEMEMAAKIASLVFSIEKVRLVSSGTEATMTALRVARGFTGRSKIIKFSGHYHGHVDALLVQAGSATSKGVSSAVIDDTIVFPFNDFDALRLFFRNDPRAFDLAAVILEPVAGNMGVVLPEPGFLEMLRNETERVGALLIFDEVMTGFRVGLQGAQGLFGIDPDLSCFGKVIGGGFPVAAVAGKREILDSLAPIGEVYQAGTLSGNPVGVAAGLISLKKVEEPLFYQRLEEKTKRLTEPVQEVIRSKNLNVTMKECGSMVSLFFGVREVKSKEDLQNLDTKLFSAFFRTLFEKGIYLPPSAEEAWFISSAHTDENLDYTAREIIDFILRFC